MRRSVSTCVVHRCEDPGGKSRRVESVESAVGVEVKGRGVSTGRIDREKGDILVSAYAIYRIRKGFGQRRQRKGKIRGKEEGRETRRDRRSDREIRREAREVAR